MTLKWRTVRSRSILRDRWIDLREDQCVTPSGVDIGPYYVLSYPDWVHIVAITPADDLVLVRQYRHAAGAVLLELPAGTVDPSDTSTEHAARRDFAEEPGYSATSWKLVSSLYPNPATHTNLLHVYLAVDVKC